MTSDVFTNVSWLQKEAKYKMELSKVVKKDKNLNCFVILRNLQNNQEQTKPEERQEKQFFLSTSTALGNTSTYTKSIVGPD